MHWFQLSRVATDTQHGYEVSILNRAYTIGLFVANGKSIVIVAEILVLSFVFCFTFQKNKLKKILGVDNETHNRNSK